VDKRMMRSITPIRLSLLVIFNRSDLCDLKLRTDENSFKHNIKTLYNISN
jgi:hypothetical protein